MLDTYYNVGSKDKPVYSNSSGSALNPEQGGSIQKFMNFFTEREEKKETITLENGKLVHSFIEYPKEFVIADITIPAGMLGDFIDELHKNKGSYENFPEGLSTDIDTNITSKLQTKSGSEAQVLETKSAFSDLAAILKVDTDTAIRLFRLSRKDYYTSYTEAKLIEHFKSNGLVYFNYLKSTENKIVLTLPQKETVQGCIDSLCSNKIARHMLKLDDTPTQDLVYKELAIYWEEPVRIWDKEDKNKSVVIHIPCKAKLDVVRVNHEQKVIIVPDLKTKKGSLYTFGASMEHYKYHRQSAFYKKAIANWFIKEFPDKNIKDYQYAALNVVVESTGNHLCGTYRMGDVWMQKGKHEYQSLLSRLAWHLHYKRFDASREEIMSPDGIMLLSIDALGAPIIT